MSGVRIGVLSRAGRSLPWASGRSGRPVRHFSWPGNCLRSRPNTGYAGRNLTVGLTVTLVAGWLTVPAFAGGGGQGPGTGLLGVLKGSEVSTQALAAARGQGGVNLNVVTNTTNDTLNVDAASSGTVNGGSVLGGTTGFASNGILNSSGIISQFSNSGNNVLMSSSVAIFINAH